MYKTVDIKEIDSYLENKKQELNHDEFVKLVIQLEAESKSEIRLTKNKPSLTAKTRRENIARVEAVNTKLKDYLSKLN